MSGKSGPLGWSGRQSKAGLVLLDSKHRVIGMNTLAHEILGVGPEDLGRKVQDYHRQPSRKKVGRLLGQINPQQTDLPVAMIIDVSGKVVMISLTRMEMVEAYDGPFMVAVLSDVTDDTQATIEPTTGLVNLQKFPVYEDGGFIFLETDKIFFIESDANYCRIWTADGSHHVLMTLKHVLERYPDERFFQVHKSYLANLNKIESLTRSESGGTLIDFGNDSVPQIPVARRRLSGLKSALGL